MKAEFIFTWEEQTIFITPTIVYNNEDKEVMIGFLWFCLIIKKNKPE